ncbi:hypothetical protein NDU88_003758 [Pleurodeles waltl]|uniref:Secreted protein n=1 Tax=Pleurodeles waltl TaxID=8319 RepID=A0AAV7WTY8_PLEWA|nr:hypothetical protein NDU88_003758 [Pleurodeles waltl]
MARQMSLFWWALTYMTCTREEEQSLPTVLRRHRQLGHMRKWRNPPVYRPLVDLLTMEERHLPVPFLQEDDPDDGVVAAVEPVDSDEDEAAEENNDNRESVIQRYFQ